MMVLAMGVVVHAYLRYFAGAWTLYRAYQRAALAGLIAMSVSITAVIADPFLETTLISDPAEVQQATLIVLGLVLVSWMVMRALPEAIRNHTL